MKFLCNTEFIHSGGGRAYFSGTVYSDITASDAETLIALDKKKPLGALSFFTPMDEEAADFIKAAKDVPPKASKAELIAEAKSLGVKGADRMSVDELKEAIAAVKAEQQTEGQQ
ncbi:MAG: hypothetical protein LBS57_12425 [Treponema sp.]|jgi:hypothetical protein|nr:hypothetical protein [Treponema sp.]